MSSTTYLGRGICVAAGAVTLAIAGAAVAQPAYTDGITVYGPRQPYRVPDSVTELQTVVSYADLDLNTERGRWELSWRIDDAAQHLCDRLGEGEERGRNRSVLPTCQASARDSARTQVRRAVENARYYAAYSPPTYYSAPPPAYYTPLAAYAPPVSYAPDVTYSSSTTTYVEPRPYWPDQRYWDGR